MTKLKSMDAFRRDVLEGDIVRVVATEGQEFVGYYSRGNRYVDYITQDWPSEGSPNEISIDFRKRFHFICTSLGEGNTPRAVGYEVLRRKE